MREEYETGVRAENAEYDRVVKVLDLKMKEFDGNIADLERQETGLIWEKGALAQKGSGGANLRANYNTRLNQSVAASVDRPGDGEKRGNSSKRAGSASSPVPQTKSLGNFLRMRNPGISAGMFRDPSLLHLRMTATGTGELDPSRGVEQRRPRRRLRGVEGEGRRLRRPRHRLRR